MKINKNIIKKSFLLSMIIFILAFMFFKPFYANAEKNKENQKISIKYSYRLISEKEQKEEPITTPLQSVVEKENSEYFLFYEPINKNSTQNQSETNYIYIVLGFSFFVLSLVIAYKFKRRKTLMAFILISASTFLFYGESFAQKYLKISSNDETFEIIVGENLKEPKKIEGYLYVGYLRADKPKQIVQKDSEKSSLDNRKKDNSSTPQEKPKNEKIIYPNNLNNANSTDSAFKPSDSNEGQKPAGVGEDYYSHDNTSKPQHNLNDSVQIKTLKKEVVLSHKELPIVHLKDSKLEKGKTRTVEGKDGRVIIEYELYMLNGVQINYKEISRTTVSPVATIFYEGTKEIQSGYNISVNPTQPSNPSVPSAPLNPPKPSQPKIRKETRFVEEDIPFGVDNLTDSNLEEGVVKETLGVLGRKIVEYQDTFENDILVKTEIISTKIIKNPTNKIITTGTKKPIKNKPVVNIASIIKDLNEGKIFVDYKLVDNDSSYVKSVARVYKKSLPTNLVKEVDITNLNTQNKNENIEISDLERNVEYILKTHITYNDGAKEISFEEENILEFKLEFKKVEFKNILKVGLYDKNDNPVISLKNQITTPQDYYVKLNLTTDKEIVVPVKEVLNDNISGREIFKVKVQLNELVHFTDNKFVDGYYLYVDKEKTYSTQQVYHNFEELIKAINNDLSGTFILGSNLSASNYSLPLGSRAYLSNEFRGKLIGKNEGNIHFISGLKAPLFETANNATIKDIKFINVNIDSDDRNIGTIVNFANSTNIENVLVSGKIKAKRDIGGISYKLNSSTLTNVAFEGEINSTQSFVGMPNNHENKNFIGGIFAEGEGETLVTKAKIDAKIKLIGTSPYHKAGAVAGVFKNPVIVREVYAKGEIINQGKRAGHDLQVGGLIGSVWRNGVAQSLVSEVRVSNGRITFGDSGDRNAKVTENYIVENMASGTPDTLNKQPILISSQEAKEKVKSFDITIETSYDLNNQVSNEKPYSEYKNYDSLRQKIYQNIEKLIPFYDKETIINYGNRVDLAGNLNTKEIQKLILLKGNLPLHNLFEEKQNGNALLVYYKDGSSEILKLKYSNTFSDLNIEEYVIEGKELIYTPEKLSKDYTGKIADLINELQALNYMDVVRKVYPNYSYSWASVSAKTVSMGGNPRNNQDRAVSEQTLKQDNVDPYSLKESFESVKNELKHHIISLIETSLNLKISFKDDVISDKIINTIKENKEEFMLGLSYIDRWYSIKVGDFNLRDFTLYHQDLLGKNVNNLENIINIAKVGNDTIRGEHNTDAYSRVFGSVNGKMDVEDYLEFFKNIFDKDKTMNEWFKSATKAEIYESVMTMPELKNVDTTIWHNLTRSNKGRKLIIPMLAMKHKGLAVVSTPSSVHISHFDKYADIPTNNTFDGDDETLQKMRGLMKFTAEQMVRFFEFWYRMVDERVKDKVFNNSNMPMLTWDGYKSYKSHRWRLPFTEAESKTFEGGHLPASETIKEFYEPIAKWFRATSGTGAYADGREVFYIYNSALDKTGSSVMTHETTHNLDSSVFFEGYGRRDGMGAEDYALGMLQSVDNIADLSRGINVDTDYSEYQEGKLLEKRLHNATPERFQNRQQLQEFYERSYDLTYLISRAEAEILLSLSKEDLIAMIRKVEMKPDGNHYIDKYRFFTAEEIEQINTFDDLINNNAVVSRLGTVGRDTYATENMFLANFGAYTTPNGGPGSRTFKQTAFEILAAGGYEGFLNYVSNKLFEQARSDGKVLSDEYILNKTFGGQFNTFNDLRRAKYQKAYDNKDNLKPFTLKGTTYTTYDELKELVRGAVMKDLVTAKSKFARGEDFNPKNIIELKSQIYRYYLINTDDFRQSIFKD